MKLVRIVWSIFLVAGLLAFRTFAFAEGLNEIQPLSFGNIMLINNDMDYTMTITPAGVVTNSNKLWPLDGAQNGVFQAQGFDPNMDLNISITPPSVALTCVCGGPDFTITSFIVSPAIPHTDGLGNATFNLGATLHTSGNSVIYEVGSFSGTLTVNINY